MSKTRARRRQARPRLETLENRLVPALADLVLTCTVDPGPVEGGNSTYHVTVSNSGPADAVNVVLTDFAPATTAIVPGDFAPGFPVSSSGPGFVHYNLGTIAAGNSVSGTIQLTTTENGSIANAPSVTTDTPETSTTNNSQTATVTVADAPLTNLTGFAVNTTAGAELDGVKIAGFTDVGTGGGPSDHTTALVDWGDGTATSFYEVPPAFANPFVLTVYPASGLNPRGSHTYLAAGNYTITTTFTHNSLPPLGVTSPVTVAASPVSGSGTDIGGYEFTELPNVAVATFTRIGGGDYHNYTVTIDWGDGTTSGGFVSPGPAGSNGYGVYGAHTYTDESRNLFPTGRYPITVAMSDTSGSWIFHGSAGIGEELMPDGTTGTPTQRFVAETYRDLLDRGVDAAGLANWNGQLALLVSQGMSLPQAENTIVLRIETDGGHEYYTKLVESFYETYLARTEQPSDGGAPASFVATLAAGAAMYAQSGSVARAAEMVRQVFVSGPEYFARHGSDHAAFVAALYQDVLGRGIGGDGGAADAIAQLNAGRVTREQVAHNLLFSSEYAGVLVADSYEGFLDRAANPASPGDAIHAAGLSAQLLQGVPDEFVLAMLLSDPGQEFLAKVTA
jgi:uncharacterized repeat protein (TIGR01451 family)